jgi:predicted DCC family thiol-disulfide oxidoreductase YuxK
LQSRVGDLLIRRMSDELRAQVLASPLDNGGGEDEERYKSIVVCGRDTTYIRSSAVYKILQLLEGSSKRLRLIQYLALIGYVLPTRVRDGAYQFISKRRKKWFGSSDECLLWDDRFEDRFVDDGVLTGSYRDPFANPHAEVVVPSGVNLFEGESPLVRGDRVRIIWPSSNTKSADPSVSYDSEFPDGICLIGGIGKISTVDLPNRVVLRVDRESIGLGNDGNGDMTVFAWVKPQEIAAL